MSSYGKRKGLTCAEPDCEEVVWARMLCKPHYMVKWEGRDRDKCEVVACPEPTHRKSLCVAHYQRAQKYGDPLAGGPRRRRRGTGLGKRFYEKRRAVLKAGAGHEVAEYGAILLGDCCSYCGGPVEHVDHIDPLRSRGDHHWANLTAACAPCNHRKSTKPLLRFLLERG